MASGDEQLGSPGASGFNAHEAAEKAARNAEGGPAADLDAGKRTKSLKDIGPDFGAAGDTARKANAARRDRNVIDSTAHIPARILWPALGFPAVIAPGGADPSIAARALCLLVLSGRDPDRNPLSKADAARHLGIVPWAKRRKRRPDAEVITFPEEEIEVRRMDSLVDGARADISDGRIDVFNLGGTRNLDDPDGRNGFLLGLSTWVRKFYAGALDDFPIPAEKRLPYLYEVRIAEHALARLIVQGAGGGSLLNRALDAADPSTALYHVFWMNRGRSDDESDRSDELDLLLEQYARRSRFGHDGVLSLDKFQGKTRQSFEHKHMREYEYEFSRPDSPAARTEVLHPVFVRGGPPAAAQIGQITDLHLDQRTEKYAERLRESDSAGTVKFHNWNTACADLYAKAKGDCDFVLMTGDLIDYGRGYNGSGPLGDDKSYWRDRNWFLFYEFLAGGDSYARAVYTSLGNHDWRINPYPADTFGSPAAKDFGLTRDQLHKAHGDGFDKFTYSTDPWMALSFIGWKIVHAFTGSQQLKLLRSPLETNIHSVSWYLLLINPFLDYAWRLPGGYHLVMLDWAEDESVDLHVILGGEDKGKNVMPNTYGGPKAKNCITSAQKELVSFVAGSAARAKILAIHAPPVGPWGYWKDDELSRGRVQYNENDLKAAVDELAIVGSVSSPGGLKGRQQQIFEGTDGQRKDSLNRLRGAILNHDDLRALANGRRAQGSEYPTLAIRTRKDEPLGREADYGSFDHDREWLVQLVRKAKFSAVLAGHIHRKNVLVVDTVGADLPQAWRGEWVIRAIAPQNAARADRPLFINTTSAGPYGHCEISRGKYKVAESAYTKIVVLPSGAIQSVEFKPDLCLDPVPAEGPAPPPAVQTSP